MLLKFISTKNCFRMAVAMVCAVTWLCAPAQSVIFPQKRQPGKAVAIERGDRYVLQNNVLDAAFVHSDGKLHFGGSTALHLGKGTELFRLILGDSTVVESSVMTL